jgi:hypothetical protein
MKKILTSIVALVLAIAAQAQTMNVVVGSVVYQFPAAQVGDMVYGTSTADDSKTLTLLNKTLEVGNISQMYVDDSEVTDNTVAVAYDGTSAKVTVA